MTRPFDRPQSRPVGARRWPSPSRTGEHSVAAVHDDILGESARRRRRSQALSFSSAVRRSPTSRQRPTLPAQLQAWSYASVVVTNLCLPSAVERHDCGRASPGAIHNRRSAPTDDFVFLLLLVVRLSLRSDTPGARLWVRRGHVQVDATATTRPKTCPAQHHEGVATDNGSNPSRNHGRRRVPLLLKTYTCTSILISKRPLRRRE